MISVTMERADAFARSSRAAQRQITTTVSRSLKRGLAKSVTARRKSTMGHPMLDQIRKSPWGKQPRNRLTGRIKQIGKGIRGGTVDAGIGMYGYAAAVRTGDRIPAHTISGPRGSFLHPGARVIPQITGSRTLGPGEVTAVLAQLEAAVGKLLRSHGF